jgi:hypothetical protein
MSSLISAPTAMSLPVQASPDTPNLFLKLASAAVKATLACSMHTVHLAARLYRRMLFDFEFGSFPLLSLFVGLEARKILTLLAPVY